ncbi:MAG: glutamate-5-semialdehyde dehydrogenase [Chloroflexi bacterium CFX4]|nr:glutamate-5-semialdehyde dehydrogenase [Chloroflexi bacterium CFX4]MDL1921473.1 glutamate-5-semialdehyde dehydrogenase [Chloroflexi bacterium CFX3]
MTNALDLPTLGRAARAAARQLARLSTDQKNAALHAIADALSTHQTAIMAANATDLAAARESGMNAALLDRLSLEGRLSGIAADVRSVAALPDPIGEVIDSTVLPNGMQLEKRRTPLGVIGVIYEARPNVTVDVASLALKTGNAVILRGGKETIHSNRALVGVLQGALAACGLPAEAVQFIDSPDRQYVAELLRLDRYVDMIIPRGGAGLHEFCRQNSTIPVITGGIGICHLYVDASADQAASLEVIYNAKTQRPSVCNALDTLLVNSQIAADFLPRMAARLRQGGVTFRADPRALSILNPQGDAPDVQAAVESDWDTEWLSLILGVRVVDTLDEALDHIAAHSTAHSDGILTANTAHAQRFVEEVDSAAVYVNASTRFTDGGQFGLGAEVAVSTQKLHGRGPMGLRELTTYKWIGRGSYHVRA